MISGTSKMLSKPGPGDLLTITKMLQNIQENMEASWKILFLLIWDSQNFENVRKMYVLGTTCFDLFDSFFVFVFDVFVKILIYI